MPINWKIFLTKTAVIVAAGLWVFWPALHGGWLWDDDGLIQNNRLIHDPSGFWKIWFEPSRLIDFFPLTVTVEWLEWHLWQSETFGYHLTNVVLHLTSSLLVWHLLSKFGLRLAWLGGLIFAIHPVVVESVAWMAELKNTLSMPFFLLAMCVWIDYENEGKRRDYFLTLGLFAVAMLAKTTMVMFPAVILLYAWWKRSHIGWKDLKASAPFFAVSLGLGLVTIRFLHSHAIERPNVSMEGIFSTLALGAQSMAFYFTKFFLPIGLMPMYPKWVIDPPTLIQFLPWLILGVALGWLWTKRMTWGRHALLGLGFFLIMLIPFIGFVPGSYMEFTWVMDHLLYIPIVGLIGLVVAGMEQMSGQLPVVIRSVGAVMVVGVIGLLAWGSRDYAKLYIDQQTLWTYTIQHNPGAWVAYNNLGFVLFESGRNAEAMDLYAKALKLYPDYEMAHYNMGNALVMSGQDRYDEAMLQYEQVLKLNPNNANVHNNLGNIYARQGRISEAIDQFQQASKNNPYDIAAHGNLGNLYGQQRRLPAAIEQFEEALKIDSNDAPSHYSLGCAFAIMGRTSEAIEQYQLVLKINPENAQARERLDRLQDLR